VSDQRAQGQLVALLDLPRSALGEALQRVRRERDCLGQRAP
jgi:hypothetical protein